MTEPLNAHKILAAAAAHIQARMCVKPGWTESDHDAYWLLVYISEQIKAEDGIPFTSVMTGGFFNDLKERLGL